MSHPLRHPRCKTPDGAHRLEDAEPPFYKHCSVCFEPFLLLSLTAFRGIEPDLILSAEVLQDPEESLVPEGD